MVYLPLGASAVGLGVIVLMALIDWRNEMSQTPVSLWLYSEHSKYGGSPDIRVVLKVLAAASICQNMGNIFCLHDCCRIAMTCPHP